MRGKANIHDLLNSLAAREDELRGTTFLAPCAREGRVRTRVAGLVRTFSPRPVEFEGWGLFRPVDESVAEVVEEADLPLVGAYLQRLPALRVRLVRPLQGRTWLAFPVGEADMRQRFGVAYPLVLRLVEDGQPFEVAIARWDGAGWWFEDMDRRADPLAAEQLRDSFRRLVAPASLRLPGLTPEMHNAYDLAAQHAPEFAALRPRPRRLRPRERRAQRRCPERMASAEPDGADLFGAGPVDRRDERRLREALSLGGGELGSFRDRGDYWLVEWVTGDGERHTSAIGKADLTVVSSGICLSGRDRDFDLQSLVGVIERAWQD